MTLQQLRREYRLPAILHGEQNHFVVLYGIKKSRLTGKWKYYVANPAYGKHAFTEESFSHYRLNEDKLPDDTVRRLFNKETIVGSGELYSKEHNKRFKAENASLK